MKVLSYSRQDPNYCIEHNGKLYRYFPENIEDERFKHAKDIYSVISSKGIVTLDVKPVKVDDYYPCYEIKDVVPFSIAGKNYTKYQVELYKSFLETLEADLNKDGYMLSDPHTENVQFISGEPIYIDHGSLCHITQKNLSVNSIVKSNVRKIVEPILRRPEDKTWNHYVDAELGEGEAEFVSNVMKDCKKIIDIGACMSPFFPVLAKNNDINYLAIDSNELALTLSLKKYPRLFPNSTFDVAIADLVNDDIWTTQRAVDGIIASSITHHLFRAGMSVETLVEKLATVGKVAVEFIDKSDKFVSKWNCAYPTKKEFEAEISKKFKIEKIWEHSNNRFWFDLTLIK